MARNKKFYYEAIKDMAGYLRLCEINKNKTDREILFTLTHDIFGLYRRKR